MIKRGKHSLYKALLAIILCMVLTSHTLTALPVKAGEPVYVGDVDDDGDITPKDVTMLRRYLAKGWNVEVKTEDGDVDGDGDITPKDVTMLRRYLAKGWGVTLREKTPVNNAPSPVDVSESSLDTIQMVFDMPITFNDISVDDVNAYCYSGTEKAVFDVLMISLAENVAMIRFESELPQGETVFVDYKGENVGSIKTVEVSADSVYNIVVPGQQITAGWEVNLLYILTDMNGVNITSEYGRTLNGVITAELDGNPFDAYVTIPDLRMYCGTPNKEYKLSVKYTWYDAQGRECTRIGEGTVISIPEEPWQLAGVIGAVTHSNDDALVAYDHQRINNIPSLDPFTLDETDAVLQVGIQYYKQGRMQIDSLDSCSEVNLASYPDNRHYIRYDLRSSDEKVVMLGERYNNRVKLIPTGVGDAVIVVYGVDQNYKMEVIGAIPVTVTPVKNPALNNLSEAYVYNNVKASDIVITSADADDLILQDGTKNTALKDELCTLDAPTANVIQIAVPYSNINGMIYDGFADGPASDEFTEYIVESSDENILRPGDVVSGRMKFTCTGFGTVTLKLYGRTPDGDKELIAKKTVNVKRSTADLPVVLSVQQASLDTINVTFDRDVSGMKLGVADFAAFYKIKDVKLPLSVIQRVEVYGNTASLQFVAPFPQDEVIYIEFEDKEVGSFKAVKVSDNSVAVILLPSKTVTPGEYMPISYQLLDANGVDITAALNVSLNGFITFRVVDPEINTDVLIDKDKILMTEDDRKCTVIVEYVYFDSEANMCTVSGQTIYQTGNGTVTKTGKTPEKNEELPVESIPYRMEVVRSKNVINSAYADDSIEIRVSVFDQYGEEIKDLPISVGKTGAGNVGYYGLSEIVSGYIYTLKPMDVAGEGVLSLRMVCSTGNGELASVLSIQVGNEIEPVRYTLVSEGGLYIKDGATVYGVNIRLEGITKNGYTTVGAPLSFTDVAPKAGRDVDMYSSYPVRVYTVMKDGKLLSETDLPTFDSSTNIFYNKITTESGETYTMAPGTYVITAYQIDDRNGYVIPMQLGSPQSFQF